MVMALCVGVGAMAYSEREVYKAYPSSLLFVLFAQSCLFTFFNFREGRQLERCANSFV